MSLITHIHAREILDSRGNPTIECDVTLDSGAMGRAAVPSGASTGSHEAVELRDGDPERYFGKGVKSAVKAISTEISPLLIGKDSRDQTLIDETMMALDGTLNKSRLGANAILSVSLATARAAAMTNKQALFEYLHTGQTWYLPVPMMNIINGGAHANNTIDIQEFMIVPTGFTHFSHALECGVKIFHTLKQQLASKGFSTAVGDEGGFAPNLSSNESALEMLLEAIDCAGYTAGKDVHLALDVASTEFYHDGLYHLASEDKKLDASGFIDLLAQWVSRYPIISIEDALAEDDWAGWADLTKKLGNQIQLVGDDLFVTNTQLLMRGIKERSANAILIKPNQIGTLTETLAAIDLAQNEKFACVMSHRSGETEDSIIADLAVASNVGQIKTGSLCRSDRVSKYNQLLRIEELLGNSAVYYGERVVKK